MASILSNCARRTWNSVATTGRGLGYYGDVVLTAAALARRCPPSSRTATFAVSGSIPHTRSAPPVSHNCSPTGTLLVIPRGGTCGDPDAAASSVREAFAWATTSTATVLDGSSPSSSPSSTTAKAAVAPTARLSGWIWSSRVTKRLIFIDICDHSSPIPLQCVLDRSTVDPELSRALHPGAMVSLYGTLKHNPRTSAPSGGPGVELCAERAEVLSGGASCDNSLISVRKHRRFGDCAMALRQVPHLRTRHPALLATQRLRSHIFSSIEDSLTSSQGMTRVQTPVLTSVSCEDAGDMFKVRSPMAEEGTTAPDPFFSGRDVFLSVSGQLHVEAACQSLGHVYSLGPTFRAENSRTGRHLAEFWMLEAELFQGSVDASIASAVDVLRQVWQSCVEQRLPELEALDAWLAPEQDSVAAEVFRIASSLNEGVMSVSYCDAVEWLQKYGSVLETPALKWGDDLQRAHEIALCRAYGERCVIVRDFPVSLKPFYMRRHPRDARLTQSFDILLPRVGEVVGGSARESCADTLVRNCIEHGLLQEGQEHLMTSSGSEESERHPLAWYVDLRRYGGAPTSGYGLGVDRVVQAVTGHPNIRDVGLFPRHRGVISA